MVWEFILKVLQNNVAVILMTELFILIVCGMIGIHMRAALNKRILSVTKKVEKYLAVVMETGETEEVKKEAVVRSDDSKKLEEQNRLISDVLQEIFP